MISNSAARRSAGLISLLAFLYQGCAPAAETPSAKMDHRFELAISRLEEKTDADSLAAAGLLRTVDRKPDVAVDLLARATGQAPERADLAWLQIQICQRVSSCNAELLEAQLRVLDPSNGAGWLHAVALGGHIPK